MHESFAQYVNALHPSFERLVNMSPIRIGQLRAPLLEKCVYLFSENGKPLYVGRTNHFRQRMRQHSIEAAQHNQAVFAFRLARLETGKTVAGYTGPTSRRALLNDQTFSDAFRRAKAQIRAMELRFVAEDDPLKQTLLEIYVAIVLKTLHNDFRTH